MPESTKPTTPPMGDEQTAEEREKSARSRAERLAAAASDWAPTALEYLAQSKNTGGRSYGPADVGEVAAGMASGAHGYFGALQPGD